MALFVVGRRVLETRTWTKEPPSSTTNTIYTALTQPCKVRPKGLDQLLISHRSDLGSLEPQYARAHTNTHTCGTDQSTLQTGWEGRTRLQACDGKQKGLGKTCCWAWIWDDRFTRGNKSSCSVCERLLFPHSAIADGDLPTNPPLLVLMLFSLDTVVSVCVSAFCLDECSSFWCK